MGYLDDIIIYSRSEKEHLEHLEEIFTRLKAAGLKLKLEKCCFFKKHIQYLGHLISADGIQPLPEKLESIAKMPAPRNPKEVKQFLGLVGYYRKFVPRFTDISRVLTHLTKKDVEAGWDQVDINNYVLYYNSQVETKLAMPAPGLDISMKRAINTIIRTKLQEDQEKEIGLITPLNPKETSMGEPPEPNLGMVPPGPRRTTGGGSKPALNPGQRMGSLKEIQEEIRKTMARKKAEEHAAQAAKAAKAARKSSVKAPKGGVKKPHRF